MSKLYEISEHSIRSVIKEELEKYKNGEYILPLNSKSNPFSLMESMGNNPLMEGYFSSYPIEKVQKYLQKRYGECAEVIIFNNENGEKVFRVLTFANEHNKKIIDSDMSMAGYFPSFIKTNGNCYDIQYEPRHQNKINKIVQEKQYIYHLTPSSKTEKIFKNGLCPKTNNKLFSYPERIYFFLYLPSTDECEKIISDFMAFEKKNNGHCSRESNYALLKVETKNLEQIDFYFDPNAENCVYTKENINPKAITIEKIIRL